MSVDHYPIDYKLPGHKGAIANPVRPLRTE